MLKRLSKFLEGLAADGGAEEEAGKDDLRVAVAALLVRASVIDGAASAEETERLHALLRDKFDLSDEEAERLAETGHAEEADAVDLYRFTRVLTDRLDPDGRAGMVEMLWEVVLSDHVVDDYEANLVWRVAELLHVPTRTRVLLRQQVAARLGVEL